MLAEDIMFHHLWKPDVLHVLLQHPKINRSIATNIFCSFNTLILRISLLSSSIVATHHIQMYSDPTLITVSSLCNKNTRKLLFLREDIF